MSWWDTAKSWGGAAIDAYKGTSSETKTGIWSSVLSGVGSFASSYLDKKTNKENNAFTLEAMIAKGIEERKTLSYGAQLEDYYKQKNKQRQRAAVNSYGQFNLVKDVMPTNSPPVDVPAMPSLEEFNNG